MTARAPEGGVAEPVAISINQPWAGLIVLGLKDIENRDWPTRRRGPVLIHAGLKVDRDAQQSIVIGRHPVTGTPFSPDQVAAIEHHRATHAFRVGGIVGKATIVDCVSEGDTRSTWFVGRYGFVLIHARVLPFRPCKGALNFFRPDFDSRYAAKADRSRLAAPGSGGAPGGAGRA